MFEAPIHTCPYNQVQHSLESFGSTLCTCSPCIQHPHPSYIYRYIFIHKFIVICNVHRWTFQHLKAKTDLIQLCIWSLSQKSYEHMVELWLIPQLVCNTSNGSITIEPYQHQKTASWILLTYFSLCLFTIFVWTFSLSVTNDHWSNCSSLNVHYCVYILPAYLHVSQPTSFTVWLSVFFFSPFLRLNNFGKVGRQIMRE